VNWYRFDFTPEEIVALKAIRLQEEFNVVFFASGAPKEAGLFSPRAIPVVNQRFLSPVGATIAASLVARYAGAVCEAPKRSEVKLISGHDDGEEHVPFTPED
jgi:hypothetical protein